MSMGYLALVLHAHLPFIRHFDDPRPHRDDWLQEALVESYIPLIRSWHRLKDEGVDFRLTFSISPSLLSMLIDPYLQERCMDHLAKLVELGEKEVDRTAGYPAVRAVAEMYLKRFSEDYSFYVDRWNCDLTTAVRQLSEAGNIELITTAATHGFLPGLRASENAVKGQLKTAIALYSDTFGGVPPGLWLPECAYYPGLDSLLEREGIRYFFVDSVGVLNSRPRPRYGVHSPVYTKTGVAAFARHPEASEKVWSSMLGYPGDYDYREFYRDIGYDLDYEYLAPYLPGDGSRKDTGFKYYRITGPGVEKQLYHPEWAMGKAGSHSQNFLDTCSGIVHDLAWRIDRQPIIVAPFDAELFGHWWFEGPDWLEFLIRKTAFDQDAVEMITPSVYLDRYPVNQVVEVNPSTWGRRSRNEVWINGRNDYIYRHLHWAARRMQEMATQKTRKRSLVERAKKQAARELMLAQSSDWPFMMDNADTVTYGHMRFRGHMLNFIGLKRQVDTGLIDRKWLERLEAENNIFADVNLAHFA